LVQSHRFLEKTFPAMSSHPASSSPQLRVNEKQLDHVVQEALTTAPFPIPRVAAVVATKNQVLWSGAGGKKTYYDNLDKAPEGQVTLETPFAMFSNTKFVTCL
jgi:CubicO group peptidase (beta-lactamase class C family)